ncbi:hypothetical protein ABEB36_013497 [Hypothenemus hampei]|uniref:Uncharacterized protein n=1 Tax=Hypothenemus hampei TaxID=57062 RepID=A0ABD1E4E5_HYPHA
MIARKKDKISNEVLWQKMCWQRFNKSQPFVMEFKETFHGEFRTLDFNKRNRRLSQTSLKMLHKRPIPITQQKYYDLISLFTMNPPALGDVYKPFYYSLPHHNGGIENEIAEDENE